jgi:hypothetical protein
MNKILDKVMKVLRVRAEAIHVAVALAAARQQENKKNSIGE